MWIEDNFTTAFNLAATSLHCTDKCGWSETTYARFIALWRKLAAYMHVTLATDKQLRVAFNCQFGDLHARRVTFADGVRSLLSVQIIPYQLCRLFLLLGCVCKPNRQEENCFFT